MGLLAPNSAPKEWWASAGRATATRPAMMKTATMALARNSIINIRKTSLHPPVSRDLQRRQILHQIGFLIPAELQTHATVIVVHHIAQSLEAAIVIEPALLVRKKPRERRRAIALIGRPASLEVIHADFRGRVSIPTRLGIQ